MLFRSSTITRRRVKGYKKATHFLSPSPNWVSVALSARQHKSSTKNTHILYFLKIQVRASTSFIKVWALASIWGQPQIRASLKSKPASNRSPAFIIFVQWDREGKAPGKSLSQTQFSTPPVTGVPWPTYLAYHLWRPRRRPTAAPKCPVHLCVTQRCQVSPNQHILIVRRICTCCVSDLRHANNLPKSKF